jgi:hypothetical protein
MFLAVYSDPEDVGVSSSEISKDFSQTKRRHIPEDSTTIFIVTAVIT